MHIECVEPTDVCSVDAKQSRGDTYQIRERLSKARKDNEVPYHTIKSRSVCDFDPKGLRLLAGLHRY